MPLSEQEQRVLDELERSLTLDDRRLAQKLSGHGRKSSGRFVVMILGLVVGVAVLVLGAFWENPLVGVAGFVLMLSSAAWAMLNRRAPSFDVNIVRAAHQIPKVFNQMDASTTSNSKVGFLDRLEDRWDRRQSENL